MSKGGAGKVYFVLYLAVILELLIIFIERDEAEEHLRKQQREAIQIVQTILSQLQSGVGATAITTRPKDNITWSDKEPESMVRVYDVLVAVGDSNAVGEAGKRGDDIPELNYLVSTLGDPNIPEEELPLDTTDLTDPFFTAILGTEHGGYFNPQQTKGAAIPTGDPTAYFQLNEEMTAQEIAKGRRVKVFRVNFKPTSGAGWYRLRFASRTNQIMGVVDAEPNDDDTVRIGNVKLTVKQLRSVQKFLEKEKGESTAQQQVKDYIDALLDPEKWKELSINSGRNAIDVRVVKPDLPPPADPVAEILVPRPEIYWYTGAPLEMPVKLGPKDGQRSVDPGEASLVEDPNVPNRYNIIFPAQSTAGEKILTVTASNGGKSEASEKRLVILKPELTGGWKRQPASRGYIGRVYRPETQWEATQIPPEHYITEVKINGEKVFEKAGTKFSGDDLPKDKLEIKESTKSIGLTVWWAPNGTSDRTKWVPLVSTDPSVGTTQVAAEGIDPRYQTPTHDEGFEFTWTISKTKTSEDFSPIVIRQPLDGGRFGEAVSVTASCEECGDLGLSQPRVTSAGSYQWSMYMEVTDIRKLVSKAREVNGKVLQIPLSIKGREAETVSVVQVTVRLGS
ncbi:MAG: hypothetical protein AB7H80_00555 [Candidatus Kapaibacterium sp.]